MLLPTTSYACKPDLQITDIQLTAACKILVTVKNVGLDGVPETAYTASGEQMYRGTPAWGGMALATFDPGKQLKSPNSSVQKEWFSTPPLGPGIGSHNLRVDLDDSHRLLESNENNNSLSRTVLYSATNRPGPGWNR